MFLTSIKFLSEINITNNRPNKFQNSFLMIHFSIDPKGLYTSYIEQKGDKGSKDQRYLSVFHQSGERINVELECGSRCGVACRKITEPVSSLVAVQSEWRPKGDKKRGRKKSERERHGWSKAREPGTRPSLFPVGLISIIRKRITHSLHAPSTWSVSLHSPHSPNSRYPLTRVTHLTHGKPSLPFSVSGPAATTIVPPVIHFTCHLLSVCHGSFLPFSVFLSLHTFSSCTARVTARQE